MTIRGPNGQGVALSELVAAVAATRGDAIVVTGPGAVSGELYAAGPETPSLYNMELAYATPTAIGLSLALPERRIIAVEGDGSMFAGLGSLATVARYRPANLTVSSSTTGSTARATTAWRPRPASARTSWPSPSGSDGRPRRSPASRMPARSVPP